MKTLTNTSTLTPTKESADSCKVPCFNLEFVEEVREGLPEEEKVRKVAVLFAALSDPTRLKILLALSKGELCVCDISHVLSLSVSAVSHQLRLLRNLNFVSYRTDGKMAYYSLRSDCPAITWIERGLIEGDEQ
jgi:DNA-binding transcriptional ArsR family regulator